MSQTLAIAFLEVNQQEQFKAKLFKSVNLVTPLHDGISYNCHGVLEKFETVSS
jgi:hypothetical protein